jgi:CBS domain-containing protein
MLRHKRSCLPVVDDRGELVGILTEADFLRLATREVPPCSCGGVTIHA